MAEKKQNNELDLEKMDQVAGGFAGRDKYTHDEYMQYGVTWQHNPFKKDQYWINKKPATQKEAEKYVDLKKKFG